MEYTHVHLLSSYFYQHCVNSTSKTNLGWPGQLPPSTLALFEMPGVPCVWERNRHKKASGTATLPPSTLALSEMPGVLCVWERNQHANSIRYCCACLPPHWHCPRCLACPVCEIETDTKKRLVPLRQHWSTYPVIWLQGMLVPQQHKF